MNSDQTAPLAKIRSLVSRRSHTQAIGEVEDPDQTVNLYSHLAQI